VNEQHGKKCALLSAADFDPAVVFAHFQGAQDAELRHR